MPSLFFNSTTSRQQMTPQKKIDQVKIETGTWKRLIDFFMEENIQAKNRLSGILRDDFNNELLDGLEDFQTRFIKQDQVIHLLRVDITELDKLIAGDCDDVGTAKQVDSGLDHLRSNICNSGKLFFELQTDFNRFLTKYIC